MNCEPPKDLQCNYIPNSLMQDLRPCTSAEAKWAPFPCTGEIGRFPFNHPNDDFEQPRMLWTKVLSLQDKINTINNICMSLGQCNEDIQKRMLDLFYQIDQDLGDRVKDGLKKTKQTTSLLKEKISKNVMQQITEKLNEEKMMPKEV